MSNKCDFCSSTVYKEQGIIESSVARVLYPLHPVNSGHFMIITRRHVSSFTELTDEELSGIKSLVSTLFKVFQENDQGEGFNLLNNSHQAAGQHIPHFHLHLFIRKAGEISPFDVLSKKVPQEKLNKGEWRKRLSQIKSWLK